MVPCELAKPLCAVSLFLWLGLHYKAIHESCRVITGQIIRVIHQLAMERNGCFDPFDNELIQGPFHLVYCFLPGLSGSDQLGDHGIIIRGYGITAVNMGIQPDAMSAWGMQRCNPAGAWPESVIRIFRIDPAFYGMKFWEIIFTGNGDTRLLPEFVP